MSNEIEVTQVRLDFEQWYLDLWRTQSWGASKQLSDVQELRGEFGDYVSGFMNGCWEGFKAGRVNDLSLAETAVLAERVRQIEAERYTAEHDDQYIPGVLALGGAAYAVNGAGRAMSLKKYIDRAERLWPFNDNFKPGKSEADARGDLVKAAAMIIAEIERMDRAAEVKS